MTERTEDVLIIIDHHTGNWLGTRVFFSEREAIGWIQNTGHSYNPDINPIMPAKLVYRSDRS